MRSPQRPAQRCASIAATLCVTALLTCCAGPSQGAAVAVTEAPSAPPPEPTAATPGTFAAGACLFALPEELEGDSGPDCGILWVPENWENPRSDALLRLAVAILRGDEGAAGADSAGTVIYLAGGPGASVLESLRYGVPPAFEAVRASGHDLVLFDQRGVGRSRPALDCPETAALALDLADRELAGREVSRSEAMSLVVEGFVACGEDLGRIADLAAYNSVQSAHDVAALHQALDLDPVTLWGGSYGTRLALEVMRSHPDGIGSVILDAVYPPDVDLYVEAPANFDRALQTLFARCDANSVCSERFPDLATIFYETVARLNEEPVPADLIDLLSGEKIPSIVDGDVLVGLVFQLLYSTEAKLLVPELIYDAAQDDFAALSNIRSSLLVQQSLASRGMMFSVQCREEIAFSSIGAAKTSSDGYPELGGTFAHGLLGTLTYQVCNGWDAGRADPRANEPVRSPIPTLVMSGEFDPITPPAWGERVAQTLETAYVFEFPGIGHGASSADGCPREIFLAFLADPTDPPDSSCLDHATH